MDDTETQSYREEQGKAPQPDPRDRMADVPITFSSDGSGGIVGSAPEPSPVPGDAERAAAAENQASVMRGAERLQEEDADQSPPSSRS